MSRTREPEALYVDKLRAGLEALRGRYDVRYLSPDPLEFVHRYSRPEDQEIVGLVASALAFGQVTTIRTSVLWILDRMENSPSRFVRRLEPRRALPVFARFRHRWTTGRDIVCLLYFARQMVEAAGSIGGFFGLGYDAGRGRIDHALDKFAENVLGLDSGGLYRGTTLPRTAGVRYFFPSPRGGAACKRMNLYLRWMARPADGLDLGLWEFIPPSRLVIPLDTHIGRIGRHLGWTSRKTPGWKMALDITRVLAMADPDDPTKYDFALSRMGILERCPRHPKAQPCDLCSLRRSLGVGAEAVRG